MTKCVKNFFFMFILLDVKCEVRVVFFLKWFLCTFPPLITSQYHVSLPTKKLKKNVLVCENLVLKTFDQVSLCLCR